MKKDWSNLGFVALLPILTVLMIYATEAFVRSTFFVCNDETICQSIPANIWNVLKTDSEINKSISAGLVDTDEVREVIALRYSGRIAWFFLGEIFALISLVSLGVASALAFQLLPKPRILWTLGVIVLSLIVGLLLYANPKTHMTIFLAIFEEAITPDVPSIGQITDFLNSLGNVAVFSLLLTICATLLPSNDETFPDGMKQLSRRMNYLRIILYTGTFLLVTAILFKKSVYQWSLAYTSQDEVALKTAMDFVASLLTLDGGFYTLVLAAGYFPAVLVLQRRAQVLVDTSIEEVEKGKKMQEYGLTFSFRESLPRILAILGPFLAGPVGDLLTGKFF